VNLIEWAKRWADEARAHGARPAMLTVWPEQDRYAVFPAVIANYSAAARAARAASFPAGVAWVDAARRVPGLRLYGPDGFHPSRVGTYLTAAVVYTGLTGELPRALPRDVAGTRLGVRLARTLRASVGVAYRGVKAP
jgi:lysophospholipase L1-like esterase